MGNRIKILSLTQFQLPKLNHGQQGIIILDECMILFSEAGHRISPKSTCTHVYTNCESGLATIYKACCTQAGLVHAAGADGMDR